MHSNCCAPRLRTIPCERMGEYAMHHSLHQSGRCGAPAKWIKDFRAMNNERESSISGAAKIIIGVERSKHTGWFLLHLYDCLNAISIRPDEGMVVIAEGRGRGRLRNTRIRFKDVLRLDAYEVQIGHNCLSDPVSPEALGRHDRINKERPFTPVGL